MDIKSFQIRRNIYSRKMNKLQLILVIAFFATCSSAELPSEFIIGGRDALPGQFPFMVSLRYGTERLHGCGGGILNPRWVLSVSEKTNFQRILLGKLF